MYGREMGNGLDVLFKLAMFGVGVIVVAIPLGAAAVAWLIWWLCHHVAIV